MGVQGAGTCSGGMCSIARVRANRRGVPAFLLCCLQSCRPTSSPPSCLATLWTAPAGRASWRHTVSGGKGRGTLTGASAVTWATSRLPDLWQHGMCRLSQRRISTSDAASIVIQLPFPCVAGQTSDLPPVYYTMSSILGLFSFPNLWRNVSWATPATLQAIQASSAVLLGSFVYVENCSRHRSAQWARSAGNSLEDCSQHEMEGQRTCPPCPPAGRHGRLHPRLHVQWG